MSAKRSDALLHKRENGYRSLSAGEGGDERLL